MTPEDYLKRHYSRCFRPLPEGGYASYIREFIGCCSQYLSDDIEGAYQLLESVARDWIAAALDMGQEIPEPIDRVWGEGK